MSVPAPKQCGPLGKHRPLQPLLTKVPFLRSVLLDTWSELASTHATRFAVLKFLILTFLQSLRVTPTACPVRNLSPSEVLRRTAEAANGGVGECSCAFPPIDDMEHLVLRSSVKTVLALLPAPSPTPLALLFANVVPNVPPEDGVANPVLSD